MTRIAIAGFQHETNTFGVTKTGLREFEIADSWPGLLTGAEVIPGTRGINLPIAGFAAEAMARELSLEPILWCAAEPAAEVTDAAFDEISARIISGLVGAGHLDGIYLDLHGAMVTESHQDGEGELLRRIRAALGDEVPIAVSLDLHANLTGAILRHATTVAIFRTYPHLDMAATGARCVGQLIAAIEGYRPHKAMRRIPFLIPLHAQFTGQDPCAALYHRVAMIERFPSERAEFAMGFPAADIRDAGAAVIAFAPTQERANEIVGDLADAVSAAEAELVTPLFTPDEAVREAEMRAADKPVVIGDVQDNPGAGATSDTTGLLHALARHARGPALLGLMADSEIAKQAHLAGKGTVISGTLGGKMGRPDPGPYEGRFLVETISQGRVAYTGEMYGGGVAELGPSTALKLLDVPGEIRVAVTSQRSQCLDLALFRGLGLEPLDARIICVKSTVHFRADFDPIASDVLYAAAPGVNLCQLAEIPYRRLREGVRLGPLGPNFSLAL
ncbi:MAG: M81 family metallopeptidase [Pseudomonadota bacterium]